MVHVISSVRTALLAHSAPKQSRPVSDAPTSSLQTDFKTMFSGAAATSTTSGAAGTTGTAVTPSTGTGTGTTNTSTVSTAPVNSSSSTGTTTPTASTDPPTVESVFGPSPWIANPTGTGPTGSYAYNPWYFATPETAAKVAQMVGGTVVQTNSITPNGGPFSQSQPNQMVQLPNGSLINPGLIASLYTHGYSQSFIDQMVANEVKNA